MAEPFGRYSLLKRLAGGGMGEVFLARQEGIQGFEKLLVIKTLLPHLTQNKEFVEMFLDEARLAARLAHPNVIQIFDLGQVEDVFYIAMEYVHGEDLKRMWKQAYHAKRTIPTPIAVRIVADAAAGLGYAHRLANAEGQPLGLVHRDVSPQNILLTFDGGVKLIDFGVAKAAGRATQTQTGALKGKYAYMSPEQVEGEELDRRSDVFALGIVLWEMTTGSRLFRSESDVATLKLVSRCEVPPPSQQNPDVPPALDPIVLKALAKDREQRYQDMEAFRLDLENWLAETRSPGSAAHLATYMRDLFSARLEREGPKGALSDVDPDATGFSPFGNTRNARARPTSETGESSRSLVRPSQMTGDLVQTQTHVKVPVPLMALGGAAVLMLGAIAYGLLKPHDTPHNDPVNVTTNDLPTVKLGELNVTSTPTGAQVLVDGVDKGLTPMQHLQLPSDKPVRVEVRLAGYKPWVAEGVSIPSTQLAPLEALPPVQAQVSLRSEPAGATVFANGQPIGTTPATWTTSPGAPVTLTFKLRGYHSQEKQITPGQQNVAEANLVREKSSGKTTGGESAPAIKMNR